MALFKTLILSTALIGALTTHASAADLPAPPPDWSTDTAPVLNAVPAYADTGATNQRGKACMATLETNAAVRLLSGFLISGLQLPPSLMPMSKLPPKAIAPLWQRRHGTASQAVQRMAKSSEQQSMPITSPM